MLKRRADRAGFTIVEVLIAVAVIGVLAMMAMPTFGEWLQSQQLRAGAEAGLNGLQVARSEAIRRNLPVQIVFQEPNTGWTVMEQPIPLGSGTVAQTRAHEEGSPNAQFTMSPAGATTVTFTPLGGVAQNADGSLPVTRIDVTNTRGGACQPAGPMRCLRIVISAGGTLRMCDPHPSVTVPDPRAC